jgi:signal-transduction protein with cAMP-binding, CBS, and nucleotidyltransferase domain
MRITKSYLKQIIKEELEYGDMFTSNEATELRDLYQAFKLQLSEQTPEMVRLDEEILEKIEQIEIRLNELAK